MVSREETEFSLDVYVYVYGSERYMPHGISIFRGYKENSNKIDSLS